MFDKMTSLLKLVTEYKWKIVYLDEAVFTYNTFNTKAWCGSYKSITVPQDSLKIKTHALISAVSEDVGLEACAIHPKSINATHFIAFIE